MKITFIFISVLAALAPRAARADDGELVDIDGDGDIDDDDRAALEAAEVIAIEHKSAGAQLAESSRAVTVIDLSRARERAADLGEVLARSHGIAVQRDAGLGSPVRFSLNGLRGEQVRMSLDGIPLDLAGFPLGVANVPADLIQRVDVYRGVVPISLGADALGGAIDLVTDPSWVDRGSIAYQVGSFGTHRVALGGRVREDATGLALGMSLFADRARNDYLVDVTVADDLGREVPARVRRFHDAYTAGGAILEGGLIQRGPIERAIVRVYQTAYDKELQNNIIMSVPYGEASYAGDSRGLSGDLVFATGRWRGRLLLGVTRSSVDFRDVSAWAYDWYGRKVQELQRAETGATRTDQRLFQRGLFARALLDRQLGERQHLRIAIAPTSTHRTGEDFLDLNPDGRDPANAERSAFQLVSGIEHELTARRGRLENTAFAKHYYRRTDAEQLRPGFTFQRVETTAHRFGLGDSARLRLSEHALAKASYEWATRMPSDDEMFGDGVLVAENLALVPEVSHNANLELQLARESALGAWTGEVSGFARRAAQMIALIPRQRDTMYQNVSWVRVLGVEGMAGWTAPRGWATVQANGTLQDLRNTATEGEFREQHGDRIPARPWLFGSLEATVRRRDLVRANDELALFASSRYVHKFFRGWESQGKRDQKQAVPSQLVHGIGVTYAARGTTAVVTTLELQNITNEAVYDSFGAQRPGRAIYLKLSGEL